MMVRSILKLSSSLLFQRKMIYNLNKVPPLNDAPKSKNYIFFPRRYMVAFLGFLCAVVMHCHRMNITFAMVAMVNSTPSDKLDIYNNETMGCPLGLYNSTDLKPSRGKFQWSPELQGYILGAGFLGYVLMQIPGGILAGRFGSKKLLVPGLFVAAACNILSPMGARNHPYILLTLTLIRGMAQGIKQPALCVLMAKWFTRNERGFLSAFIYCGYALGAFVTSISSGSLSDLNFLDGWPLVFYTYGLLAVIIGILFCIFYYDSPEEDPRISEAELKQIQGDLETNTMGENPSTPWLSMLLSIPVTALAVALFGVYWLSFFFVTVHPIYLATILHIPIKQNGTLSSIPYLIQLFLGVGACYFSYWMSKHTKVKIDTIRKGFNTSCVIFSSLGLFGMIFVKCNIPIYIIFFNIAVASIGFSFAGSFIASVDLSPTYSGPLMGYVSTIASIAPFLIPVLTGKLTNEEQSLRQWGKIMYITIGVSLGSAAIFQFLGSAEIQPWDPVYKKPAEDSLNNIPEGKIKVRINDESRVAKVDF